MAVVPDATKATVLVIINQPMVLAETRPRVEASLISLIAIAEAEIYAKFNEISGDKTAIYISHRLSSCKFCDEIAVFHDGAVIQQGTHEQLLADEGGKYHELWNAQSQYYTDQNA